MREIFDGVGDVNAGWWWHNVMQKTQMIIVQAAELSLNCVDPPRKHPRKEEKKDIRSTQPTRKGARDMLTSSRSGAHIDELNFETTRHQSRFFVFFTLDATKRTKILTILLLFQFYNI